MHRPNTLNYDFSREQHTNYRVQTTAWWEEKNKFGLVPHRPKRNIHIIANVSMNSLANHAKFMKTSIGTA